MTNHSDTDPTTSYNDLLHTNPILSDDIPVDNARAVLALLTHINLADSVLGDEGNHGLFLVHEWLRRSLAYTGHENELTIPLSSKQ